MALTGYFGPRGRVRPAPATPPPPPSQAQLRAARQRGLTTHYSGCVKFTLSVELAALAEPFADLVAALPEPGRALRHISEYVDRVHEAVSPIAGWAAQLDGLVETEHLRDRPDERRAAQRLIADLAPRPALPEVTPGGLVTGHWVGDLVEMAEPLDNPLRNLLRRGTVPAPPAVLAPAKYSDKLRALLGDIDRAGVTLTRDLEAHSAYQAQEAARARRAAAARPRTADDMRAELRSLGVQV